MPLSIRCSMQLLSMHTLRDTPTCFCSIEEHTILDSTELSLAIQETASYLTLYGIQIYYETDGTMQLSGEKILTSYAVLEDVIEEAIYTCQ